MISSPDINLNPASRTSYFKRASTSCAILLSAYLIANVFHQLFLGFLSYIWGYETTFSYHYVMAEPFAYKHWGNVRVFVIYTAPPVLCFLLAAVLHFINFQHVGRDRLFVFWLKTCFLNVFLTQLFIIPFGMEGGLKGTYQTFAIVAYWFRLPVTVFLATSIIAVVLSILYGLVVAFDLHVYAHSSALIEDEEGKNLTVTWFYLFPFLMALPLILGLSNSHSFWVHLMSAVLLFFPVIGMRIRNQIDVETTRCSKEDVLNIHSFDYLILALLLLLLIVLFL